MPSSAVFFPLGKAPLIKCYSVFKIWKLANMGLIKAKRKDLFCHYLFAFRTACVFKATSLAQKVSFLSLSSI